MRRKKKRVITPHEPGQPVAGMEEGLRDGELAIRIWEEKQRRYAEAMKKLQGEGMTVLLPPTPKKRRARGQT